jgi:hypothetical protein
MLKPAIIIGLGGTGNQVVRRLKRLVQQQYGDTPTLLNFLVVDTDEDTFNDQSWTPLPALSDLERVPLYDAQVPFSDVRNNPEAYPEIHEWLLPTIDVGLLDRQEGAGQVRMLGRLALYKSFGYFERRLDHLFNQCQKIQTLLEAIEQYDFNVEIDPVIYMISSVCGGQGAGSFIDVAVALRALANNRFPRLNLIGVLTLPSVYADRIPRENWSKVCANTHAAMKEADYLMHSMDKSKMRFRFPSPLERVIMPQAPLFDLCYLVDNRHQRGTLNGAEEIYDQIADQLFLEIGTPFGARSDSARVNLNTISGLELDRVFRTGRRYSGFGNHTISFNRKKIVELSSLKSTYITVHDRLLGNGLTVAETEETIGEFTDRHHIDESNTGDLIHSLITNREIGQELVTAAYSQDRADHTSFSGELWVRLDAFWLRRAVELRAQMERRARAMLDGTERESGILSDIEEMIDSCARRKGVSAALNLAEALLSRLRAIEASIRAEHQHHRAESQRLLQEAENTRTSLTNIGQELNRLVSEARRASLFSQLWRLLGVVATFGLWHPGAADEEDRARQFNELNHRAQEHRNRFLAVFNQAIEHRLAEEARAVAAEVCAETISPRLNFKNRLELMKARLEDNSRLCLEELEKLTSESKRNPFVGGNTMRRDVTADYFDQYHDMHSEAVIDEVIRWLLPQAESYLASLEIRDREQIRQRFYDRHAEDILHREGRDSLAEMIDRFSPNNNGGGLTDRIGEGLRFCLPFWDIRVPGNQFTTEVLLVGLEQDHLGVQQFLTAHAAAQRGQVYPQVVPTGQDSVILISRIAHGASYYWHAQDEAYFREYAQAIATAPYPVHLHQDWRRLPEPIPDPIKYERRVFALGLAYEFIAVRGAAYYLDLLRRYSLVGTSRQDTADWKTIPLLEAVPSHEDASQSLAPAAEGRIYNTRSDAMQKFIDADHQLTAVREKLTELFNDQGREIVRRQLARYCREALDPAIKELEEDDPVRHQLEIELADLEEVVKELKPVAGTLRLTR